MFWNFGEFENYEFSGWMIHIFNLYSFKLPRTQMFQLWHSPPSKNIDYIRASHNIFPPVSTPTSTIMVIRKTDRFVSYYAHWYVALHFVSVKLILVFIDNLMIENTIIIETAHQQHFILLMMWMIWIICSFFWSLSLCLLYFLLQKLEGISCV